MCYIKQIIIMSIGEKKLGIFFKFYNTDFVLVKDIPSELGLWVIDDIGPNNLKEIFLLQ